MPTKNFFNRSKRATLACNWYSRVRSNSNIAVWRCLHLRGKLMFFIGLFSRSFYVY